MSIVYLLGEDHSQPNRDAWFFGQLLRIEKEYGPLLGISLELDHACYQKPLDEQALRYLISPHRQGQLIANFVEKRKLSLFASDDVTFSDAFNEVALERKVQTDSNPELVDTYRILRRSNMRRRNDYAAQRIALAFDGRDGVIAHRCGISHLSGLSYRLKKDYDVRVADTRRDLQKNQVQVYTSDKDILLGDEEAFVCLLKNGQPIDRVSATVGIRWPDGYARARAGLSQQPEGISVNFDNTPPIIVVETPLLGDRESPESPIDTPVLAKRLLEFSSKRLLESMALPSTHGLDLDTLGTYFTGSLSRVVLY